MGQVPGSRFQPWAHGVVSLDGPVPLLAPFYFCCSLEAEMAGPVVLTLLLLLGELSADMGGHAAGKEGAPSLPRGGCHGDRCFPQLGGGGELFWGELGQVQPSKTLF